jgi:hypothetical protein
LVCGLVPNVRPSCARCAYGLRSLAASTNRSLGLVELGLTLHVPARGSAYIACTTARPLSGPAAADRYRRSTVNDLTNEIAVQTFPPRAAEATGSSAHLILNPAAGSTAAFLRRLVRAARERGIRVRVLEPGQDARLAALEAVEEGARSLAVAGGDGSVAAVWRRWPRSAACPSRWCPRER